MHLVRPVIDVRAARTTACRVRHPARRRDWLEILPQVVFRWRDLGVRRGRSPDPRPAIRDRPNIASSSRPGPQDKWRPGSPRKRPGGWPAVGGLRGNAADSVDGSRAITDRRRRAHAAQAMCPVRAHSSKACSGQRRMLTGGSPCLEGGGASDAAANSITCWARRPILGR